MSLENLVEDLQELQRKFETIDGLKSSNPELLEGMLEIVNTVFPKLAAIKIVSLLAKSLELTMDDVTLFQNAK